MRLPPSGNPHDVALCRSSMSVGKGPGAAHDANRPYVVFVVGPYVCGGLPPPGLRLRRPLPQTSARVRALPQGQMSPSSLRPDSSTTRLVHSRGAGVRGTPGAGHDGPSPLVPLRTAIPNTKKLTTITVAILLAACASDTAAVTPPGAGVTDARAHAPADVARDVVLPPCDPTFPSIQKNVFDIACSEGTCHGPPTPAWGLILTDGPAARERLVGKVAQSCTEFFLVTPGEPAASFLWLKVSSPRPPCGEPMPFGGPPLPAWSRSCIRDWISSLGAGTDGAADSGL